MSTNCFKLTSDQQFSSLQYGEAISMANASEGRIWFDVQGSNDMEISSLLDQLHLSPLARRICIEGREMPGYYPLNTNILMVIPVQTATTDTKEMDHVTLLLSENFLVTIRYTSNHRLQQITTLQESSEWLTNNSIPGFVTAIILLLSLETLQQLSELRQSIILVEKLMDDDPQKVDPKELSEKRTKLLILEAIVNGQIPTFQALMASDKSFFRTEANREHLANALTNLQAADRSLHWLGGRIDVIRSDIEMLSQDKMNRRLGRLTTLSSIFMPITFLAGVWGMNFENMPELSYRNGYWLALSSMVLLGTGLFFYFRRRGWFE